MIKDALDTIKYILRRFLFDNDYRKEQISQQQECSWKKVLISNNYITFKQNAGEKFLDISRSVIIDLNIFIQ